MTVTALIPETKGRYRVCLQGEADLVLYGKELKQFGIAEGTDLSRNSTGGFSRKC